MFIAYRLREKVLGIECLCYSSSFMALQLCDFSANYFSVFLICNMEIIIVPTFKSWGKD